MDDNSKRYHELRDEFIEFINELNKEIAKTDRSFN